MEDGTFLHNIGLMIVVATAVVFLLRPLKIPTIVAYLIAGLLLGPLLGLIQLGAPGAETSAVHLVAEVGIALLLFLVGLELSLAKIMDVGKVAVPAGIGQVVFTALGGFGIAWLLGFSTMESIFLATALTFSSTVVVVKLLDQRKDMNELYARIAVGIFLVQNLVVIVVLTLLAGLGDADSGFQWIDLGRAFGGMALLLLLAVLAARFVLPRPVSWAARSPEMLFVWSLFWCFLFVEFAEWMDLSPEIGAFLAGLSLAQLEEAHDLRRRIHPLMNFFTAIFFIALGVGMDLSAASEHLGAALGLSLFVLIGNPLIFMVIITRFGYSEKTSFKTSVTVAQISEFSFIFAAVGLQSGLIDESILSVIAVVGLVTIAASAYMILYSDPLYAWCRERGLLKLFRANAPEEEEPAVDLAGHILVVGMNTLGRRVAEALHERGEQVVCVDVDAHKMRGMPGLHVLGNIEYTSVMEETGLHAAKLVVSALQIEDTNNLIAFHCQRHGVPCAIHAFDYFVVDALRELGVTYLMDSKRCGRGRMEKELRSAGVLA